MSDLGVIVGVPIVCLVVVVVIVVVVLIYLRWRKHKQNADLYRDEGKNRIGTHGTSTMRSDESEHPYENPSLPRKAVINKNRNNNDRSNSALPPDQYASLKGQSLPHHYEGLGGKKSSRGNSRVGANTMPIGGAIAFGEDSLYDELNASTDRGNTGTNSDFYFQLEPGSRGGTAKSASGLDGSLRSNPHSPYDKIVVANDRNNTGKAEDSAKSGTRESSSSSINPYYFKVERNPSSKSDTYAGDVRNVSKISAEISQPKDDLVHVSSSYLQVASHPDVPDGKLSEEGGVNLQHVSSYDKLDRELLRQPPADDHVITSYSKLLPRLASEETTSTATQSPTSLSGYQTVQTSSKFENSTDSLEREKTEYSKLDRGRQREIRLHLGHDADGDNSTPPAPHENDSPDENIPVEL